MTAPPRTRPWPVLAAVLCSFVAAASSCATRPVPAIQLPEAPQQAHFMWVQTECVDGRLPLAETGFEQTLGAMRIGERLQLVFDTSMIDRGCTDLTALSASPDSDEPGLWNMQPEARITLPPGAHCGPTEATATRGQFVISGEELRLTMQRSPWCRGFDATVRYRAIPAPASSPADVVRRYLLHFARRDASSAAQLFSETGSLVEPFTHDPDGNTTRHRGRGEVIQWLTEALEGPHWAALRVRTLSASGQGGQFIAEWEYMDDALGEPVLGRNLFVVADGEIFETEVQLLSIPVPLPAAQPLAAAGPGPTAGDAGVAGDSDSLGAAD